MILFLISFLDGILKLMFFGVQVRLHDLFGYCRSIPMVNIFHRRMFLMFQIFIWEVLLDFDG